MKTLTARIVTAATAMTTRYSKRLEVMNALSGCHILFELNDSHRTEFKSASVEVLRRRGFGSTKNLMKGIG